MVDLLEVFFEKEAGCD